VSRPLDVRVILVTRAQRDAASEAAHADVHDGISYECEDELRAIVSAWDAAAPVPEIEGLLAKIDRLEEKVLKLGDETVRLIGALEERNRLAELSPLERMRRLAPREPES
jgi:hypothetical protein